MQNATVRMTCVLAFVVTSLVAGCGTTKRIPVVPTVTATTPANGATGVPITQVITASFNEAMNATTINASTFTVAGPGGTLVGGTVTFSGTTASFTPMAALAPSTLYTATITTGAENPRGNSLASNFVWMFTTGAIPTVISTNPLNGARNVVISQKITATFSQAMSPTTVMAAGTFTVAVAGAGGAAVPGAVTYVAATNTATFAPTANLLPSTQYTGTISTSAQSATGNALAANFVWSFTTG
ncbi:MAG TPA: Ig-like domain-containing protein, partial [Candidatus Acidoferrales bacterium]|nr:Ig-like domain-containing protein [Candidatus Acidoferrales bacterium]